MKTTLPIAVSLLRFWLVLSLLGCSDRPGDAQAEAPQPEPSALNVNASTTSSTSRLWGEAGELWTAESRLPDFSHAGYRGGETPPHVSVAANVKDFGAVGDGENDDTEAIRRAIASIESGAVLLPEGRYKITDKLVIKKSGVVLRGEGPEKTALFIPKSLLEIERGEQFQGLAPFKTSFSFGGAFVEIQGSNPAPALTKVVADAKRGARTLQVENAGDIVPGMKIHLWMASNPELGRHLHADKLDISRKVFGRGKRYHVDWVAAVESVEGDTITLDRPLRTDVRLRWQPELRRFSPSVASSGVEGMTFEFAGREKREHLMEEGFNAVELSMVADCWVRNLRIIDADLGVLLNDSRFCTVEDIEIVAENRKGLTEFEWDGITGHHGLWAAGFAQENLFQNFVFKTKYHHDLTVENFALGNVFRRGRGLAINFDHHCLAPMENLFTDIHTEDVSRLWLSSGAAPRLPHTAARTTVWNVRYNTGTFNYRSDRAVPFPPEWPQLNVVGVAGLPEFTDPEGNTWIEPLPGGVIPPDLYEAQRTRRAASDQRR